MLRKILILLLLAACAFVWVSVFEAGGEKPRRLTPEEQREAGGWKRRGE